MKYEVSDAEGLNVLSLFDGMSCGREALERLKIPVANYYAAEIDKYAISIALKNYIDTVPVGDVTKLKASQLPRIDLLIGGSPCQGFSFAGKQLNFDDPRSKLFFEFARLIAECKPKFFFLENVVMKKEYQDVISKYLGAQPVMLNSAVVSAQSRKRLYWTNIPGYTEPEDKGILLKDIVHEHCLTDRDKSHAIIASIGRTTTREYFKKNQGQMVAQFHKPLSEKEIEYMLRNSTGPGKPERLRADRYIQYPDEKAYTLTANTAKGVPYNCFYQSLEEFIVPFDKTLRILDKEVERGKVGYFRKDSQANRVYYIHDKAVTLCGDSDIYSNVFRDKSQTILATIHKENPKSMIKRGKTGFLVFEPTGVADESLDYLFGVITPDRIEIRQNGQRFNDGTKFYTLTAQDRHGILIEGYIRKLTPIECERLQTLPDNYTAGVSNSQRYKMLGNGWTVDAICEFFKHIPYESLDLW